MSAFAVRISIDQARSHAQQQAQCAGVDVTRFSQEIEGWLVALQDEEGTIADDDDFQRAIDTTITSLWPAATPDSLPASRHSRLHSATRRFTQ
jgi:hypothetical protein